MNPNLIALLIIIIWGIWTIVDKSLVMNIHPIYAEMYLAIASFLLVPLYLFLGKHFGIELEFNKSAALWTILSAVLAAAGGLLFLFLLLKKPASWTVAVTAAYPIVTLLIGKIFLKEQISLVGCIGVLLVVSGLIVLGFE
ncbi:MAG: EamA family transporter [Deltaproteobacteria bacterium]